MSQPVLIVFASLSFVPLCAFGAGVGQPSFDVDGDGRIAPADILALVDHMRQLPPSDRNTQFDLDGSGTVDESDVAMLVRRLQLQSEQAAEDWQSAGRQVPHDGLSPALGQIAGGPVLTSYTLVPQTPGPYAPSSSVDVDVVLTNHEGQAIQPRLITLDFSATDAALTLPGTFGFQLVPPLVADTYYVRFETMPMVDIVYTEASPIAGYILDVSDGGTLVLGTITVALPAVEGTYSLDVINPAAPDTNSGARLDYGFDPDRTTLHTLNGNLGGSPLMLVVAQPECQVDADCDDLRECTIDSCDPTGQCVHEAIPGCVGIPATSDWGLGVMLLLAACAGTIVFARRQRSAA